VVATEVQRGFLGKLDKQAPKRGGAGEKRGPLCQGLASDRADEGHRACSTG
jgi:hypothetical protein